MKYKEVKEATFLARPNRFVAHVTVDGVEETVHVKNTGRCENVLIPGCKVILEVSDNPKRKTKYDLVAVYSERLGWVNIDSLAPNALVKEWLASSSNTLFPGPDYIKPECPYGESRFDFYLEKDEQRVFMEAKGCTLEYGWLGAFPDAPTERGAKHLRELIEARKEGYECYLVFVIQMNGITHVKPNRPIDPDFADAMRAAIVNGVTVLNLQCKVEPDSIEVIGYNIISHL